MIQHYLTWEPPVPSSCLSWCMSCCNVRMVGMGQCCQELVLTLSWEQMDSWSGMVTPLQPGLGGLGCGLHSPGNPEIFYIKQCWKLWHEIWEGFRVETNVCCLSTFVAIELDLSVENISNLHWIISEKIRIGNVSWCVVRDIYCVLMMILGSNNDSWQSKTVEMFPCVFKLI